MHTIHRHIDFNRKELTLWDVVTCNELYMYTEYLLQCDITVVLAC